MFLPPELAPIRPPPGGEKDHFHRPPTTDVYHHPAIQAQAPTSPKRSSSAAFSLPPDQQPIYPATSQAGLTGLPGLPGHSSPKQQQQLSATRMRSSIACIRCRRSKGKRCHCWRSLHSKARWVYGGLIGEYMLTGSLPLCSQMCQRWGRRTVSIMP